MMTEKNLEYYMRLPYKIEIVPDEEGDGYHAEIPDLKGCMAFGETIEEALNTLEDVKKAWLEIALERGWSIAEPVDLELRAYSGRFNVRLPRYLHRNLARLAESNSTSLNQLVVAFLAEAVSEQRQTREQRLFHFFERDTEDTAKLLIEKLGDRTKAREMWEKALAIYEAIEDPRAERVRGWLQGLEEEM